MKKLFVSLFLIVAVLVGAVIALPFLVPSDVIRDQVVATVKAKTGRDLVIRGNTSFAVFPTLGVTLEDVTLSDPPAMGGGTLLQMKSLNMLVKLWPLLRREVEIERFVLNQPVINLRVDGKGRKNWEFARLDTAGPRPDVFRFAMLSPITPALAAPEKEAAALRSLYLREVRIYGGTVNYADARSGVRHSLRKVNLVAEQAAAEAPLVLRGDFDWQREVVQFDATLPALKQLNAQGRGALQLNIKAPYGQLGLKGTVETAQGFALRARTEASSPSLDRLVAWLGGGSSAPALASLKKASITGQLQATPAQVTFGAAVIKLADMTARGDIAVELARSRPLLRGALHFDRINLAHFTGADAGSGRAAGATSGAAGRLVGSLDTGAGGRSPAGGGGGGGTGDAWSAEPLGFEGLRLVDAKLNLQADRITHEKIHTGRAVLRIDIDNGRAETRLEKLALYRGEATGRVIVNARDSRPSLRLVLDTRNVDVRPLLNDAAGFDWLSGKGNFNIALNGNGRSQREIVGSLGGSGALAFRDGAIEGIDIAKLLRNLDPAALAGGLSASRDEKTAFTSLTANFKVKRGVVILPEGRGVVMMGPLLRMRAHGTISLPRKTLDINARPKLVASARGQGGRSDLAGIEVPVRLTGPWSAPRPQMDLQALLGVAGSNIKNVQDLKKSLKGLKGDNLGRALKGLLSGGGGDAAAVEGAGAADTQGASGGQDVDAGDIVGQALNSILNKDKGGNKPDPKDLLKDLLR